jgi:predicted N-acetyltransferase YhbS
MERAAASGNDVLVRPYEPGVDYERVSQFLIDLYVPGDKLRTWLQPRWEYMHSHPDADSLDLAAIGLAETTRGELVGVVHPEATAAFCYLQTARSDVRSLLVDWAQDHLGGWSTTLGREALGIYVDDADIDTQELLKRKGFHPSDWGESHARMKLDVPVAMPAPRPGYIIQSLAEENDLAKVNRVLWRGFNHQGDPPEEGIQWRARAQATPNYRMELNIVAVAPNGDFAAYSGSWYVAANRVAYIEPVATDPAYRRLGLGTAVVLEAVRRARRLGATTAWVGSDQEFYLQMGFEVGSRSTLWLHQPTEKN